MKKMLMVIVVILFFALPCMAVDEEGSDFTELAAAPAANDWLVGLIDVSDTTDSAEGTSKKLLISYLFTSPIFTTSLRLQYDATNYLDVTILDDGHTTFTTVDPDGAEADINFAPDGNVGIKTVAPSTALEVTGTVTATAFAGPLTGAVTGNASTATALATTRAIGGVNFDGTAAITPTTIVVADTEDATAFVGLWDSATGSLLPKTDEQLTYVANTGVLTAVGFVGALTGNASTVTTNANLTGEVTSVGNAATIADSVSVSTWNLTSPTFTTSALMTNGSDFRVSTTTTAHEFSIQVYDNDDTTWRDALTFTNGDSPSVTLGANVTLGGLGLISAAGGITSLTPVTDTAANFNANFTGANLYGGTFICNVTGTIALPVMGVGMNFTIITLGDIAVVIDTNAADGYLHNGVTGAEGKNITNLSAAGDMAVVQYYTADDWLITTNEWTPE